MTSFSPVNCLCVQNDPACAACRALALQEWEAVSSDAAPGRLLEDAILQHREHLTLGILQNADFDLNAPLDPDRPDSVSPLMTALRTSLPQIVCLIASQPGFDLARSLPAYECFDWARSAPPEMIACYLSLPGTSINQPDGNGKTLLHEAVCDLQSPEKIDLLLAVPGISIDIRQTDGATPLYRAGLAGNIFAFEKLLERGANINNANHNNRWSILMCAAAFDRLEIARQLLARPDLDLHATDSAGNTALHLACVRGHTRMIKLLLEKPDIAVNLKNAKGQTPLALAAFGGHADIVRALLLHPGVEINFVDHDRQTPLFSAVSAGRCDVARLLLADVRANAAIRNFPGRQNARDMALALGYTELADLLSARVNMTDVLSPGDNYVERPAEEPSLKPRRRIRKK